MSSSETYWRAVFGFALVACALVILPAAFATKETAGAASESVRIESGLISGVPGAHDAAVRVFKGVPFAAPPIGELRWKLPQDPAHWSGVRQADHFAPGCLQPPRTGALALIATSQRLGDSSEDCLYLNVWTAAGSAPERRAVMVWFPGGGFITGGASALVFDGEALARKGVVVVTVNYRLGVFGFFAHPELNRESPQGTSGNYGLMDQIAALKWVKRNISAFQGDPNNVTIFGQSAGSVSVFYQMASPLSKGLFHRAIGESGGGTSAPTFNESSNSPTSGVAMKQSDAISAGVDLARSVGARSIDELRAVPANQLLSRSSGTGPIVDGFVVTDEVIRVFRSGKQHNVPLLVGGNTNEGSATTVSAEEYVKQSRARFGDLYDSYIKLYPGNSDDEARASQLAFSPDSMAWRMWIWADAHARTAKSDVFIYTFSRPAPAGDPGGAGRAHHGAELPYVFHNQYLFDQKWTAWDHQLEDIMSSYWVNFARSGNPNGKDLPRWSRHEVGDAERSMSFGDRVETGRSNLNKAKVDFFESYYNKLLSR